MIEVLAHYIEAKPKIVIFQVKEPTRLPCFFFPEYFFKGRNDQMVGQDRSEDGAPRSERFIEYHLKTQSVL